MALNSELLTKSIFGAPKVTGIVGVELLPDGMAIASKDLTANQVDGVTLLADDASSLSRSQVLSEYVESNGLEKRICNVVLDQSDYQLLLVEAPGVPEEEMREAIRWRIKELIDLPLENTAIDIFFLPKDGTKGSKPMVYVVAANLDKIKSLVDMVLESGLELSSIDIKELALRNISLLKTDTDESERGMAIARVNEGQGCVSIYRQGNLYLSRQFKIGYSAGLLDDLPVDSFVLEVQRSLDYYERQMGQAPPTVLYICGENISEDKVTSEIQRGLPIPVKFLELHNELQLSDSVDSSLIQLCLGAIGALSRSEVSI